MLRFSRRTFDSFRDRESGVTFRDIEFHECYFESCAVSITSDPALRSTVRNMQFNNCSQRGCSLNCAIVEDVLINGFNTNGQVFQTWGAVFNRVVLKGKIDDVMLSNELLGSVLYGEEHRQREIAPMRAANAEYYRTVEWALDISRAEFKDVCIRGIPAHLIRRDPETQVVVTLDKATEGRWQGLEFQESQFATSIQLLMKRGDTSVILTAPKRSRKFRRLLADIRLLKSAGIAEPD
jgi:hypothetical protein